MFRTILAASALAFSVALVQADDPPKKKVGTPTSRDYSGPVPKLSGSEKEQDDLRKAVYELRQNHNRWARRYRGQTTPQERDYVRKTAASLQAITDAVAARTLTPEQGKAAQLKLIAGVDVK